MLSSAVDFRGNGHFGACTKSLENRKNIEWDTRQGSNALNRSMQGLWSQHRKAKINLNAQSQSAPASSGSTPAATPVVEDASTPATPAVEKAETAANPEPEASTTEPRTSTKRKPRSSRNTEDSSKRVRLSSQSGSIAKDHAPPTARLSDLGGVEACVEKVLELVAMPLCHPEVYIHTGVHPPRGVLLHGPPGCGKTLLAHAIAGVRTTTLYAYSVCVYAYCRNSGSRLLACLPRQSCQGCRESRRRPFVIRSKRQRYVAEPLCTEYRPNHLHQRVAPCLLFIDEIDAITPKRESAQREMERRIVAQFLTCMDGMLKFKIYNVLI